MAKETTTKAENERQLKEALGAAAEKPRLGQSVFVYETARDGLDKPLPGLIVEVLEPQASTIKGLSPLRCHAVTFQARSSRYPNINNAESVVFCATDDELRAAAAAGRKWVCKPYDPTAPEVYVNPDLVKTAAA